MLEFETRMGVGVWVRRMKEDDDDDDDDDSKQTFIILIQLLSNCS